MVKTAEQLRWESLGTGDKIKDWGSRHKWGIILGSWATSMVGSFGIIMRNPHQSFSQKVCFVVSTLGL